MKDYKSLIADIRTEACELADKLKRLEVFMMSDDFCKISPEQKSLLEQQYDLMAKYKVTLVKRAHRTNYEHEHEKACTCEPEKEAVNSSDKWTKSDKCCSTCLYNQELPNGPRCKTCDNGSNWMEPPLCETCKWNHPKEVRGKMMNNCTNSEWNSNHRDCYEERT